MGKEYPDGETRKGEGWVGSWYAGQIGWALPSFVYRKNRDIPQQAFVGDDDKMTLCKITIEPMRDRRGRLITRSLGALKRLKGST